VATIELDGREIRDLEAVWARFGVRSFPELTLALSEELRSGPLTIRWVHSDQSRRVLGYPATIEWLRSELRPDARPDCDEDILRNIAECERGQYATLFDMIVEAMRPLEARGVTLELR
jgi:hypothetical protein